MQNWTSLNLYDLGISYFSTKKWKTCLQIPNGVWAIFSNLVMLVLINGRYIFTGKSLTDEATMCFACERVWGLQAAYA